MLARKRRVSKSDFSLFKKPLGNFSSGPLSIRVSRNSKDEPTRLSVVVSKKIAGSAVVRNRIRRQILSIAREFVLKSKSGFVCLIYPSLAVKTIATTELKNHIKNLFVFSKLL